MGRRILYLGLTFSLLVLTALACAPMATSPPAAVVATATPEATPTPSPEVEERIAEVEWPASMRVGDSDVIRFSLIPTPEGGYLATPEIAEHEVEPTPLPLAVRRPGYTGYAVASLSASGLNAEGGSPAKQPLVPGQANTWRWTICPDETGTYRVVVSLVVRWEPNPGSGLPGPLEEAVWSRVLTVEARTLLGLPGRYADWLGVGGSALGAVAGLPFAEKVVEALWKRVKRARKK